ncbi:MAG: hypothetical protein ACREUC_05985 [Steroidobacteraceae bacterium]
MTSRSDRPAGRGISEFRAGLQTTYPALRVTHFVAFAIRRQAGAKPWSVTGPGISA